MQRTQDGVARYRIEGFVDIGPSSTLQVALILFLTGWIPYLHWQGNVVSTSPMDSQTLALLYSFSRSSARYGIHGVLSRLR
jgi:hypothetical protein